MSSHELVLACGRMDPELSADDLPECLRCTTDLIEEDITNEIRIQEEIRLKEVRSPESKKCKTDLSYEEIAKKIRLRHAGHINIPNMLHLTYVNGESLEGAWATIEEYLNMLFPVGAVVALDQPAWSMPNLTTGRADRIPFYTERDRNFHLACLQSNETYADLYRAIRLAINTVDEKNPLPGTINSIMREAAAAKEKGALSTQQFDYLTNAAQFQKDYMRGVMTRLHTDRLLVLQAPRRFSHANREIQRIVTEVLECVLDQHTQDHPKTAMRVSRLKSRGKQKSY